MTAVSVRRVKLDAPAAVSVRRSLDVSLRTSPTDIPRTPRAMTIPKTVAQPMTADDWLVVLRLHRELRGRRCESALLIWRR